MKLQRVMLSNTVENANQIAIARIMKAYIFWTITDCWGDVPYTDALNGDPNVAYDTQESIYKDLIKELTESVSSVYPQAYQLKEILLIMEHVKLEKACKLT